MSGAAYDAGAQASAVFARLIAGLPRFPAGDGRARLRALVAPLARTPTWRRLDAIKIAGSNGKGSAAVMTAAILGAAGVRCAALVSPHVRTPAERVQVAGAALGVEPMVRAVDWTLERLAAQHHASGETAGVFEAIMAMSLFACCAAEVETMVVEAGIGGRLDPSGVVPGRLTGLVSVDLEHTALLGETRQAIARDKADLADPGTALAVGDLGTGLIRAVREHAARRRVTVIETAADVLAVRHLAGGPQIDLALGAGRVDGIRLGLAGDHQAANAALAARLARLWLAHHRPALAAEAFERAVRQGLGRASLPGRFERAAAGPDVWVDVAHTPAAVAALSQTVRRRLSGRSRVLVAGVSAGRDPVALLSPLLELPWARAVATRARHRGGDVQRVAAALHGRRSELVVEVEPDLEVAIERARRVAHAEGGAVLVAGGFFLAAEALAILEGRDPGALGYF